MVEIETLRSRFDYDAESGVLTWKALPASNAKNRAWNGRLAGKPALHGIDATNGYRRGSLDNKKAYAHRVVFALCHGRWPEGQVDHVNNDRSDNRISNLRECTRLENHWNARSWSETGFKGVKKCRGKWQAQIQIERQHRHLGTFTTPEEAAEAYDKAAVDHFGEFARTNAMMRAAV